MPLRVRVIGCGNPDAGDDAAGLLAVRAARERLRAEVDVVEAGPAVRILDLLGNLDRAVVVDAVREPRGARPPGTIIRAEAGPEGLPAEVAGSLSSHGFGVAEAIRLAAVLGTLPPSVFIGIEVADVAMGRELSPEVATAFPGFVEAVIEATRSAIPQPPPPAALGLSR
jgi:hydrogenase maturation protease